MSRSRRSVGLLLATACAVALTTCILPRNFEATLVVRKDRTYSFSYRGILTIAPVKASRAQGQPADPDEEALIDEVKKEFADNPEQFKKAVYLGDGDFDIVYEVESTLDKDPFIGGEDMPLVSFTSQPGGRVTVGAFLLSEDVVEMAASAGIKKINGKLTLETDGRILKHNARSAPTKTGAMSSCSWQIDSLKGPHLEAVIELGSSK